MEAGALNNLVKQLRDRDPEKRRQAIIELGRSQDPAALKPLADVYKTDPDPALRELALKAGRHIRQAQGGGSTAATGESAAAPQSTAEVEATPRLAVVVTKQQEQSAKAFVDEALNLHMNNEDARALRSLKKALQINPNLTSDGFFTSLAGAIMNVDASEAITKLTDETQIKSFAETERQEKRQKAIDTHLEEAQKITWASVSLDIGVYMIVLVLVSIFPPLIISETARNYVQAAAQILNNGGELLNPDIYKAAQQIASTDLSIGALLAESAVRLVFTFIFTMIAYALIHVCAKYLLGGKGTLPFLIYNTLSLNTRWLVISTILGTTTTALIFVTESPLFSVCLAIPTIIFTIFIVMKYLGKVGETYDFGAAKGCLASCMGTILTLIIAAAVGFVLSLALGVTLSGMLPQVSS